MLKTLTENDFEVNELDNNIRRVVYDFEDQFDNEKFSFEKQKEYSYGLLPESTRYKISPPQ